MEGWAKVEGNEDYSAMAIYKVLGDQQNQQAAVTGDPTLSTSFSLPFDETSGALVGLALTNPSSTQQTALIVAYDDTGKVIVNDFRLSSALRCRLCARPSIQRWQIIAVPFVCLEFRRGTCNCRFWV